MANVPSLMDWAPVNDKGSSGDAAPTIPFFQADRLSDRQRN